MAMRTSFPAAFSMFPERVALWERALTLHQPFCGNLTVKVLPLPATLSTEMVPW